jgi:hypothetical protein
VGMNALSSCVMGVEINLTFGRNVWWSGGTSLKSSWLQKLITLIFLELLITTKLVYSTTALHASVPFASTGIKKTIGK